MQTILGAGGPVGRELAKALRQYTTEIRLVARNPKKVHQGDILHSADLTHADEVMHAVQGSEVAYLTVGLPYGTRIWERDWPVIMHNVIEACSHHKTKLVYFDNIYMYDPAYLGRITSYNVCYTKLLRVDNTTLDCIEGVQKPVRLLIAQSEKEVTRRKRI